MKRCKAKHVTYYTVVTPGFPFSVGEEYSITETCRGPKGHLGLHGGAKLEWAGGETTTEYRELQRPVYAQYGPFRMRIN